MGFLKDLTTLTRQGFEMQQRMDVGATMAQAQEQMAQASRLMAASMPAPTDARLEAQRLRTTATVVDARQLPMMIGMNSLVELDLHVLMPGGVPMPASRTEQLAPIHLARVAPGATLDVSLVPGRPDTLRVEWA
ncbi:hypothetical protein MUN74_13200 [Agromyces endophyticus]|uniref:hypothetical protein n=1 Tax=Agromyces sp. H17E-10 TaxID=2932244 RepID=UPI001FD0161B|nr:hypothetical protein [Agromyces sp. H17E-10]UOQ88237.1 hypothetical protein MUN74_13200 [Agromyces sp. H17E-10]